nr:MAG TPA: tail protein [Caudoviricetes sp.]DAG41748.1 MAG TPA: tail protein [Caudoviricetes sp.]
MTLPIYSPKGKLLYEMPNIFVGCKERKELMKEDYVELHFNLAEPVFFPIGSYCTWHDKVYQVTEIQSPTYDSNTGGYNYELKLEAYYFAWKNRMYKYKSKYNNTLEASFNLTADLEQQVITLVRCLNDVEGMCYNGTEKYTYKVHKVDGDDLEKVKTQSYSSVNYIDALAQIAEAWNTEWWVIGNVIHFGKCQDAEGTNVDFILGKNVESMDGSKSETDYATRVYAFGSSNNLPANWDKGNVELTVTGLKGTTDSWYFSSEYPFYSEYFDKVTEVKVEKPAVNDFGTISIDKKTFYYSDKYLVGAVSGAKTEYISITAKNAVKLREGSHEEQKSGIGLLLSWSTVGPIDSQWYISGRIYAIVRCVDSGKGSAVKIGGKEYERVLAYKEYSLNLNEYGSGSGQQYNSYQFCIPSVKLTEETSVTIEYLLVLELSARGVEGKLSISDETASLGFATTKDDSYTQAECKITFTETKKEAKAIWYNTTQYIEPTLDVHTSMFKIAKSAITLKGGEKFTLDNLVVAKLPTHFFPANKQDAKSIKALADTRLTLPSPGYIDTQEAKDGEIVEKVLVFDDIYPRTKSGITEVRDKLQNVVDENKQPTGEKYTEYYIKTNSFVFDIKWQLPTGNNMQVIFQSGPLAGLTFDVQFNSSETPTTPTIDHQFFRILRKQFDGGLYLPNKAMHPEEGNEFILTGWDSSRIADLKLIGNAQEELAKETQKQIKKMMIDPNTYECTLFSDIAYGVREKTYITDDSGNTLVDDYGNEIVQDYSGSDLDAKNAWDFDLGRRVTMYNAALFRSGKRESRVMGYEKKMDIPYDSPTYIIGEKATYSKFKDLEKQINNEVSLNIGGSTLVSEGTSGGASVYIIKTNDTTKETDDNVYSALRMRNTFLHSRDDDNAQGLITFEAGAMFASGYSGNDTAADGIIEYFE